MINFVMSIRYNGHMGKVKCAEFKEIKLSGHYETYNKFQLAVYNFIWFLIIIFLLSFTNYYPIVR